MTKIKDMGLYNKNSYQRRIVRLQRELDARQAGDMITGEFRIAKPSPGKVWISISGDGEGGEFTEKELSEAIHKFYAEKF